MRQLVKRCLILSLLLTIVSCNDDMKPPLVELCGVTKEKDFACNDMRKKEGEQKYYRAPIVGDLCTSPDDYKQTKIWVTEKVTDLVKCERELKRLKRRCN